MPLGPGQNCSPSMSEDRPSINCVCVCVCDSGGGGWLVVYCLSQHLFTHSLTVWDAKELQWMNQPCCLLHVSWLQDCGYGQDILHSIKTLCPRHKLADGTQAHYAFFCLVANFFLPALRQVKWFACLLASLHFSPPFLNEIKQRLFHLLLCHIIWNKIEII